MMDVLENQGYFNIVAVVTRYFGGTLLGVGGLIRVYQGAVIKALTLSKIGEIHIGVRVKYKMGYDFYGKVKYIAESENAVIEDTSFDIQGLPWQKNQPAPLHPQSLLPHLELQGQLEEG